MLQVTDLQYFISFHDDEFPLEDSLTIGRHLDNDVIVAGEDVLDYHLRLEPTPRGPKVHPLGEASLILNGHHYSESRGLVAGDELVVGQNVLGVGVRRLHPAEAESWSLHGDAAHGVHEMVGDLSVGRGEDSGLVVADDHVSREHALFTLADDVVWVRDLDSANGTFVNGERVSGGCRLYHGDMIAFDQFEFQLIGQGADLTPVRAREGMQEGAMIKESGPARSDTTEIAVVANADAVAELAPPAREKGTFLLGAAEPVLGITYRLRMGKTSLGRDDACDVVVKDRTVSSRHAEVVLRPEGATITNLMATNGTRVNGREIQSAQLADGDIIGLGRVRFVYRSVTEGRRAARLRPLHRWLIAGAAIVAAVLAGLLIDTL